MEPGNGSDPERDTHLTQPPTSRSADKPKKRPKSSATGVPSPDLRKFPPSPKSVTSFLPQPSLNHLHILASRPSLISHAREEPQRTTSSKRAPPEPRPVLVHSFPASQFPVMNPSYPSNGTPFPQSHLAYHHHAPTPGHSNNGVTANPMAGQSHPSPYAYPVHAQYASHPPFPHYSPYPQQIMMYAPPRPSAAHETVSQPSPTATQSQVPLVQLPSGKRKRRPTDESQGGDPEGVEGAAGASGSAPSVMTSGPRANMPHPLPPDIKKRTKTQRACDSCRSRKIRSVVHFLLGSQLAPVTPSRILVPFWRCSLRISISGRLLTYPRQNRCDILTDSEPPLCQHCKQYGFDCTFFLPIAETRFKKKKQEEEAAAAAAAAAVEKTRLENADRPNSSTPGDSRPADARVYGMGTSFHP